MSNTHIDKLVLESKRAAERAARAGEQVSALLHSNEAWQRENGNWLDWIKLEDRDRA